MGGKVNVATNDNPYLRDDCPFKFENSRLVAFERKKFLPFFRRVTSNLACEVLAEGLRAWIICPDKIILEEPRDCPPANSIDFVHSALGVTTVRWLSVALERARSNAVENDGHLLNNKHLRKFPWDLLFAMGGLKAIVEITAGDTYKRQNEMQTIKVQTVAAFVHAFREIIRGGARGSNRKPSHREAQRIATQIIINGKGPDAVNQASINNYSKNLHLSAPLIYAATLMDDADLFQWLVNGSESSNFILEADTIDRWFQCANKVAQQVLIPLKITPTWIPLDCSHDLDPSLPDEKSRSELLKVIFPRPSRAENISIDQMHKF